MLTIQQLYDLKNQFPYEQEDIKNKLELISQCESTSERTFISIVNLQGEMNKLLNKVTKDNLQDILDEFKTYKFTDDQSIFVIKEIIKFGSEIHLYLEYSKIIEFIKKKYCLSIDNIVKDFYKTEKNYCETRKFLTFLYVLYENHFIQSSTFSFIRESILNTYLSSKEEMKKFSNYEHMLEYIKRSTIDFNNYKESIKNIIDIIKKKKYGYRYVCVLESKFLNE